MEETLANDNTHDSRHHSSTVDTSRPFRSVKEAVAIFGERILAGEIYSLTPSPNFSNNSYHLPQQNEYQEQYVKNEVISTSNVHYSPNSPLLSSSDDNNSNDNRNSMIMEAVKRLERELEVTKAELKVLREREQETEVAVASLNAELHKNMSKMAAVEAAKAAAAGTSAEEERIRRELVRRMEKNPTLAQILSLGHDHDQYGKRKRSSTNKKKIKPIVPLVGDLFSKKKY
ncbi:WEB family protein At1g75720 [Cannabis sativa]|uniref:WEB family protein At1g75720 n=1 Tax=Cannabis sativa TaxID=3483 RepID=UPI0029C9CC03|nr:WEB family protein At1g75720 [Cannabis sativa]